MMVAERRGWLEGSLSRHVAPALHIPDSVRVGVIACMDQHELRFQGHLMCCEGCRAPIVALILKRAAMDIVRPPRIPCGKARALMFRYLEGGDDPDDITFAHITSCDLCDDLFFEPAQAVILREYEPEHLGEVD